MSELSEARAAAIAKRDECAAAIHEAYRLDCIRDDAERAAMWDAVRSRYETEMRRLKALPPVDHKASGEKRDKALAELERDLNEEIKAIFLAHEHHDERYGT